MPRAVLVLVVVLLLSLLATTTIAAPLPEPDRRARARAQQLLEGARTSSHRREYRLVVPELPSRLPERYSIRHHATAALLRGAPSMVIDVERDVDGARVERVDTEGLARGPVPADELDALVRLAFYLCLARLEAEGPIEARYRSSIGHVARRQLRIEGEGFLLVTGFEQAVFDEVDGPSLDGFVLTELAERFEALVSAHMSRAQPVAKDEALAHMLRRLRAIPSGGVSLSDPSRADRDATLAGLIGDHVVAAGLGRAMPLLQRKRLDGHAYALSLRITPTQDLLAVLPLLLCSGASGVHEPALGFIDDHRELDGAVLEALGCELPEQRIQTLVRHLAHRPARDSGDVRNLRNLYAMLAEAQPRELRLQAARALWVLTRDDAAGQLLHEIALGSGPGAITQARVDALHALAAGFDRRDPARVSVAELALAMLRRAPMDERSPAFPTMFVFWVVGSHGQPRHVERLLPWLDHPDPEQIGEIFGVIEHLDPPRALAVAGERVRGYARGASRVGYERAVLPFVALLVSRDERAGLAELCAASGMLGDEVPSASDPLRQFHAALVAYIMAPPRRRAAAAMRLAARLPLGASAMRTVLIERHGLDEDAVTRAERGFEAEFVTEFEGAG